MSHLRVYTMDGRTHHLNLGSVDETVNMFKVAMTNGSTINCTTDRGNPIIFNGAHITCVQVRDGSMPFEENC